MPRLKRLKVKSVKAMWARKLGGSTFEIKHLEDNGYHVLVNGKPKGASTTFPVAREHAISYVQNQAKFIARKEQETK